MNRLPISSFAPAGTGARGQLRHSDCRAAGDEDPECAAIPRSDNRRGQGHDRLCWRGCGIGARIYHHTLERAIAAADGIEYLAIAKRAGISAITARLKLNYDATRALSDIISKWMRSGAICPPKAEIPVIEIEARIRNLLPLT